MDISFTQIETNMSFYSFEIITYINSNAIEHNNCKKKLSDKIEQQMQIDKLHFYYVFTYLH